MQFKVPQDVQREDTIVGPLTLKQMIIMGMGGGLTYAIYTTLAKAYYWQVWLPPTAIMVIITLGFTFARIHDLSLFQYLVYLTEYLMLPRKRIWIKGAAEAAKQLTEMTQKAAVKIEAPKEKSLKDIDKLVQILDNRGMIKKPTNN